MHKLSVTFFSLFFIGLTPLAAQDLSPAETRLIETVAANHDEAIEFLKTVVNINSGTLNVAGVKEVGAVFSEAFDALGFETRWIEMPDSMRRAGHLFAERRGDTGKKLLLIGHLDTVFEEDSPFQEWTMVNDSVAHAPGGNDMKGGDVIVLYALKALHENGLLDGSQITVAFTGDEESPGKPLELARRDLIEAGKWADAALGFETASGFSYATVARRGSSGWEVETTGRRAHSSGVFSERTGAGAIFEMARILNAFYGQIRGEEFLTFNPGTVMGGTFVERDADGTSGTVFGKTNVVSQTAIAKGGLRTISAEQLERTRERMRDIVEHGNLPQTSARITFTDGYPAMTPTDGNMALLTILDQASRDLGFGEVLPYDPGRRGAADVSFVAPYVDGLDGLGATGRGAHTPDETVDLHTFEALTKRTVLLLYRLIQE